MLLGRRVGFAVILVAALMVWAPAADAADSGYSPETFEDISSDPQLHFGHAAVLRLYWAYFDREPEPGGARFWVDQYTAGYWSFTDISDFFADSREFERTYGSVSDDEFLALMYANVLDRDPDAGGFEFWLGRLRNGQTRGSVMADFSFSDEFRANHPLPSDSAPNTGPVVPPALPVCNDFALAANATLPTSDLSYSYTQVATADTTLGVARPGCERLFQARLCVGGADEIWLNGSLYPQPDGNTALPFWPTEIRYKRVIAVKHEVGCTTPNGAPLPDFSYRIDYLRGSGAQCVDFTTGVATLAPTQDAPLCYLGGSLPSDCGTVQLTTKGRSGGNYLYEIAEQQSVETCARTEFELRRADCAVVVSLAEVGSNSTLGELGQGVAVSPEEISAGGFAIWKTWSCEGELFAGPQWATVTVAA